MRHLVQAILVGGTVALLACEADSGAGGGGFSGGGFSGGSFADSCREFTSCETCTPVNGCGWCFNSDGTGLCAGGPDACPTHVFSWTWDPNGCRVAADAGTAHFVDAGVQSPVETDGAPPPYCEPANFSLMTVPIEGSAADGSAVVDDAGPAIDGSTEADAMGPTADASPGPAAPGCSMQPPGSLCRVDEFQFRCAGRMPAPAMDCSILTVPTPPGESLYCCPCFIESP